MFANTRAYASFSVDDMSAAHKFYSDTLGVDVEQPMGPDGPLSLRLAGVDALIYPKPDHRPAGFTVLNFLVKDLEQTVDELALRGVRFERYAGYESDENGIHRAEGNELAWFTDPAGNILSLIKES
jgi:catechol 2,3-dioxygenase-like lactoylglutathione lyase family enzyme